MTDICDSSLFVICDCSCWTLSFLLDDKDVWTSGIILGVHLDELAWKVFCLSLQVNGWGSVFVDQTVCHCFQCYHEISFLLRSPFLFPFLSKKVIVWWFQFANMFWVMNSETLSSIASVSRFDASVSLRCS